jgi:UDP-N-acetyl-D-glucosamine dehydrogenase
LDVSREKVDSIHRGVNYIKDVPDDLLRDVVQAEKLEATTDFSVLKDQDAISICVPTPLSKTGDPDLTYIMAALDQVKKYLRKGHIVVLESTTYPGTTEEVLLPALEESGLKVGKDFFLAFSPERIDPGNEKYGAHNTPKVIGGVTPACTEVSAALYRGVIEKVVPVNSCRAAEMVKLLENTFRSINIGLVNELAIMCDLLKVDVWEVIDAAATKPFGYMPFYPRPGLGGHCIPIDPSYLSWKMRSLNYRTRFFDLAVDINRGMPAYVVQKVMNSLNERKKCLKGSKILVLGVTYKRDIDDVRESPALDIILLLRKKGAEVIYHDPYAPTICYDDFCLQSTDLNVETLRRADCVLITTDHRCVDYHWVVDHSDLVVDTRNATKGVAADKNNVVKL